MRLDLAYGPGPELVPNNAASAVPACAVRVLLSSPLSPSFSRPPFLLLSPLPVPESVSQGVGAGVERAKLQYLDPGILELYMFNK